MPLEGAALARRAYDRLGFGATAAELEAAADDPQQAIATLLAGRSADDPGVKATPAPDLAPAERSRSDGAEPDGPVKKLPPEQRKALKEARKQRAHQATAWWLSRMIAARQPLPEKLTWFWHGHFATSIQKVKSAALMVEQNGTFRRLGGGEFRPLAQAMIIDPALLVWLDGNDNEVGAPNENLAREFMELFALGHGHYNETDVREAARALTGWKVRRRTGAVRLVKGKQDREEKTIFARPGRWSAADFVDLACNKPESAAFVVGRLWFRLVSGTAPSAATLGRLTHAYGPDGDIAAVLAAITAEPAFADEETALVKQPVEWFVGLCRALGVSTAGLEDRQQKRVGMLLRGLGQLPFLPPSVGGWPAGHPWLTTASALARSEAARIVTARAQTQGRLEPVSRATAAEYAARVLGIDRLSDRTRTAVARAGGQPALAVAVAACSPEYVVSR